jgi:hypothetical protein
METNVTHDTDTMESLRTRRALLAKVAGGLALTASGLLVPAWSAAKGKKGDGRGDRNRSRQRGGGHDWHNERDQRKRDDAAAERAAAGRNDRDRRKNDKGNEGKKGNGGKKGGGGNDCVWKGNGIQISVINGFSEQDVPGSFDGEFWEVKHKFKKERCYYSYKKVEAFTTTAGTTATESVILQTDLRDAQIRFPDHDDLIIYVWSDPAWVGRLVRQQDPFSPAKEITEEGLSLIDDSDGTERKFTLRKGPELADYNHFILEIGPTNS